MEAVEQLFAIMRWSMIASALAQIFRGRRVTTRKISKYEALLALIAEFQELGRKEVSLSEFQTAVSDWQSKFPIRYSFSEEFLYSYELFEDLSRLEYEGEIREYNYRNDAFLPKTFIAPTATGLVLGRQVLEELSEEDRSTLEAAVRKAIEHYYATWRLWSRVESPGDKIPSIYTDKR